ncbi:hypothetical protein [Cohnella sp. OV330]|uniref:DUF6933 domain-containing protein n=1 Tax=Cohnella sp. OV330 TaxID=1855288 RepID=UPI0021009015|nr:hypothetical protein [Cohnella sp. OV330]
MHRFTQKLLTDMKVVPQELDDVNSLFSWHVNILQLRRKHIIFVNDLSRLCIIMDGIRSSQLGKLQQKFVTEFKGYLKLQGVKNSHIDQYLLESGEIIIGKTTDRSVLGTMKEMTLYCEGVEFDHLMDLSVWLNKLIYKPIEYEKPIQVFMKTLKERYSE